MQPTIFNPALLQYARKLVKQSFTDPATAAGAGAGAGGASPMAGPMPPMPAMGGDPAAAGGDPAAAGGPPIEDPAAAGGDSVSRAEFDMLNQKIDQLLQAGGPGGAGGAGGQKMKIDVNTEIYQIKKLLAILFENMDLPVPAGTLLGDPAQDPHVPPAEAAKDPASAASQQSSISPIEGIQPASPALAGGGAAGGAAKAAAWDNAGAERGCEISKSLLRQTNGAAALAARLSAVAKLNGAHAA